MSLDERDLERLEKRCAEIENPVEIRYTPGGTRADENAEDFLQLLEHMCSPVRVRREEEQSEEPVPFSIHIQENITWSAIPGSGELDPFFTALARMANGSAHGSGSGLSQKTMENLDQIDMPVRLTLYVTPACPHCPKVAETVQILADANDRIHVTVIDAALFTEPARLDSVMSVPCLILDDGFRWTGEVSAEEITGMILHRDPGALSADTLKRIMEQGDAAWISDRMIEHNRIFPEYIKLLLHPEWPVRLGAIVVAEDITEKAPHLSAGLEPVLFEAFDTAPVDVKGDLLYTLGIAGDRNTADRIEKKAEHLDHPELKDAAAEAVSEIRSRT